MIRSIGNSLQSLVLLIFRAYWGYQFAISGLGKFLHYNDIIGAFQSWGIPLPQVAVGVVATIELVFGILIILGLFTRLATIPLFLLMVGAYFTADKDSIIALVKNFDVAPIMNSTPFGFALAMVAIFCFGPGKISLDYVIKKEMP